MERRFDDRVDIGSYYHTYGSLEEMGGSCPSSSGEVSSKGVRGPIDRFFQSKGNDNEHGKGHNVPLPLKDAKEASKLVTMDVGRFFFENGIPFNVAVSTSFASMCRSIGDYGQAQSTIKKRSPTDWWNAFGHETPELKKFAVNVLSLTCVASVCERNWSTFNQVHTKKRNRLTTLKMHKLVYIMYNKRLKDRYLRRQKLKENEDPLLLDRVPSDDEWLVDEEDEFRNDGDDDLDLDVFDGGDVTSRDGSHGTSSKKRKGHPTKDRNVTSRDGSHGTSSKKRKGHPTKDKGLLLIDEEDEWVDPNPDESSLDLSSDL
ncbi:hypothetical protein Q3G72_021009 [Acer saccharum]|nr:hypothetical protein Q3G72_002772 [Acer saccharum]KAK1588217.1 hypothetical protein Q3G72_021009 [Acer saccharum]